MCPEWTKMERVVTHLPGCRWVVYVNEIYRLERAAETKAAEALDGTPSEE